MSSTSREDVKSQVRPSTPDSIVDLIARQIDIVNDAKRRIDEEGIVVRDMRGAVIPHPAIAIEQAATKIAADLLAKHQSR